MFCFVVVVVGFFVFCFVLFFHFRRNLVSIVIIAQFYWKMKYIKWGLVFSPFFKKKKSLYYKKDFCWIFYWFYIWRTTVEDIHFYMCRYYLWQNIQGWMKRFTNIHRYDIRKLSHFVIPVSLLIKLFRFVIRRVVSLFNKTGSTL